MRKDSKWTLDVNILVAACIKNKLEPLAERSVARGYRIFERSQRLRSTVMWYVEYGLRLTASIIIYNCCYI